jgi:translation initiation factor IF-1
MERCQVCGKMRKKNIRVLPDDEVIVGINIYDNKKGRIVYLIRKKS